MAADKRGRTMSTPKQIAGLHLANRKLEDVGMPIVLDELRAGGFAVVKALAPDHSVASVRALHDAGYRVILRAPGEGLPAASTVVRLIYDYQGCIETLEAGNEPDSYNSPLHTDDMSAIADDCLWHARKAGIKLCTPGWSARAEPPDPDHSLDELWRWNAYSRFDCIGLHVYGSVNFDGQLERVKRWQERFKGKPIIVTEAGIAAKDLIPPGGNPANWQASMPLKADRYARLVTDLAGLGVDGCCFFISANSTPEWGSFTQNGVYDAKGSNSYWLDASAWTTFAKALNHQ